MSTVVENQLPVHAQREIETLRPFRALAFVAILLTFLTWAWWPFIRLTIRNWFDVPEYGVSLSLLVMGLALFWCRRRHVETAPLQLDSMGLWIVGLAVVLRFVGTAAGVEFAEGGSWLVALVGILVCCAGRGNVPWLLPPALFLVCLLPLPFRVEHAVSEPLQNAITNSAVYIAQLCGYPAVASGKLILVDNATVDISRLYIGLGDLVPFIALAVGLSMLVDRPWWQRVFMGVAAIPVGIVLLAARAAVVAILETQDSSAIAGFDKYGLWMMFGIALVIFAFMLSLLSRMFLEARSVPLGGGSGLKDALPVVVPEQVRQNS